MIAPKTIGPRCTQLPATRREGIIAPRRSAVGT